VHLSGILVLADPDEMAECRRDLESLPGVEVHHAHPPSGRMIAVLESTTLAGQEEGLRQIQEMPSVRLAALVEHRVDADDNAADEPLSIEDDKD
jgi:nitrate reductase NapAB chaperone NapD